MQVSATLSVMKFIFGLLWNAAAIAIQPATSHVLNSKKQKQQLHYTYCIIATILNWANKFLIKLTSMASLKLAGSEVYLPIFPVYFFYWNEKNKFLQTIWNERNFPLKKVSQTKTKPNN